MIIPLSPCPPVTMSLRLCGESSRAKRDLAIYSAPEDENKDAGERKKVTMYQKRQVSTTEPENERVYPVKYFVYVYYHYFIMLFHRVNPHYP